MIKFWNLLREDLWIMFGQFHCFAFLPLSFSSYVVTLIPKVKSPVGSLYNLVAKVLATRLKKVVDKNISPTQPTFLKGRLLVIIEVILNEMID